MSASNAIEAYLAALGATLDVSPSERERILAEVRDHLEEAAGQHELAGVQPLEAEQLAVASFGSADEIGARFSAAAKDRADRWWRQSRFVSRAFALVFALTCLYYLRFFVFVRQEPSTLVQMGLLLFSAAVLLFEPRPGRRPAAWFGSSAQWLAVPVRWQGWLLGIAAATLLVALFAFFDHDSHSASDTLGRFAPTSSLVLAVLLRVVHARSEGLATPT